MKKQFLLISFMALHYLLSKGQSPISFSLQEVGYPLPQAVCISDSAFSIIQENIHNNIALWEEDGLIKRSQRSQVVLEWPLKLAAGAQNLPYHVTGNQIDLDWNASSLLDYNCGSRTYDGHNGIDIGLWPFGWKKMADEIVDVVAAAEGTIVEKHDGEYDQNCVWTSSAIANYVVLLHADFSTTYYYHLKKGSVTNKSIGETVSVGEYLGKVGSSGISTGPHLHFSLVIDGAFLEPFEGACNAFPSFWADQRPYYEPTLHLLATHSPNLLPEFPPCPMQELPNIQTEFNPGEYVIFSAFYHDQQDGDVVLHKITRPDNSVFVESVQIMDSYLYTSYYFGNYLLPEDAPPGVWKYCATYYGQTTCTEFTLNGMTPTSAEGLDSPERLLAFPNPVADVLTLTNVLPETAIEVRDVFGKAITSEIAPAREQKIDISGLPGGVYFVRNGIIL
ncbi:MAG: peptidoglycan DD-metalloendopeptidase family protein [Saprospiraceae bacterium]|nr:peptidoglycan DD-metalloendopeptidase family protein [Saprospiraceae bacterium]